MANNIHLQMNELIYGQLGLLGILRMFSLAAPSAMEKAKLPCVLN